MLVIILRSTDCVVSCDISWFYPLSSVLVIILGSSLCVVCISHFMVLLTVVCACDNSWVYSLCCVHVAFLGSIHCGLCL